MGSAGARRPLVWWAPDRLKLCGGVGPAEMRDAERRREAVASTGREVAQSMVRNEEGRGAKQLVECRLRRRRLTSSQRRRAEGEEGGGRTMRRRRGKRSFRGKRRRRTRGTSLPLKGPEGPTAEPICSAQTPRPSARTLLPQDRHRICALLGQIVADQSVIKIQKCRKRLVRTFKLVGRRATKEQSRSSVTQHY